MDASLSGMNANLSSLAALTNAGFANMQSQIDSNAHKANAGVAAAMTVGTLAQATTPGKSLITAGVGNWKGQTSYAVGLSHRFKEFDGWSVKGAFAIAPSVGVGGSIAGGYEF